MDKQFHLETTFKQNMTEMLSENLQLQFVQPAKGKTKDTEEKFAKREQKALERWRGIICFLLNIESRQGDENDEQKRVRVNTYYEVLTHADYMEKHGSWPQEDNSLTAEGFSFILQEPSSQVHDILWHYIRRANEKHGKGTNRQSEATNGIEKSPVVEILQFIFNLTLTEPNQWYKLDKETSSDYIRMIVVPELHYLGLLT